jgi:hypothetical protein
MLCLLTDVQHTDCKRRAGGVRLPAEWRWLAEGVHVSRKRWLLSGGVVVVVALIVAGGLAYYLTHDDGESSAAAFAKQRYEQLAKAQYAEAWQSLHPAQQAVVTQDAFVQCGQQTTPDPTTKVEVKSETDEQLDVPQVGPSAVHSVALTLRFGDQLRTPTDNLIKVDGKWRWTMTQTVIDAFKAGTCPK